MIKKIILLTITGIMLYSCNDNCSDVDPPDAPSLFVELSDETTAANVFTDSIYIASETTVQDYTESPIPFTIIDTLNIMHIVLENEIITNDTVFINLNNSETAISNQVKILYSTIKQEEECFTLYKTTNINVLDFSSTLSNDIYTITVN